MALAGKNALVKATGAAVGFTAEATNTSDNQNYQIADATKQVWCAFCTITVLDGGIPTSESFTLNRLTGTVTFGSASVRTITVTGSFLPLATVAQAFDFTYSISADNADTTEFTNQYIQRTQTVKDFSASLTRFENIDKVFFDRLNAGDSIVLEFFEDFTGTADLRARVLISTEEGSAAVDGVVEGSLDFEGSGDADGRVVALL